MRAKAANALSRETGQIATSLLGGPTQLERLLLGILVTVRRIAYSFQRKLLMDRLTDS